jgi:predicted MFS family arabinose efflux permease
MNPKHSAYKWVLAGSLFVVSSINYGDRSSITALLTLLKADLGFTDVGLGVIGSVFLWSYALASPFAGYIGDRVDRSRLIVVSLLGWSAVTLCGGLVTTRWQLLTTRALLGLIESVYIPAAIALVAEYHDAGTRATAIGMLNVGNYVGVAGGGALAGYLGGHFGWRAPLLTLGAAGIIWAGVCYFILPREKATVNAHKTVRSGGNPVQDAIDLFRNRSVVILALAGMASAVGTWIFINWLPLYFRENLGLTLFAAGFLGSSLVSLSGAASQAVGGIVSDRLARGGEHRRLLMNATLILCAAPVLAAFAIVRNPTALMALLAVYSILRSAGDANIVPLLCELAGDQRQSTVIGATNMLNTITGGMAVFVAGLLKSGFGLTGVFAGLGAILAIDAGLLFLGYFRFIRQDLPTR